MTSALLRTHSNSAGTCNSCFACVRVAGTRLAWLQQTFELSAFDVDIMAITLVPKLDHRCEHLYAYLQDMEEYEGVAILTTNLRSNTVVSST